MQAVPGLIEPQVFGFAPSAIDYCDFDGYLSGILESYLSKYLEIIETDKRCMLVNYNEGPMPVIKKIASFAGIGLSDDEISLMQERSRYHSKTPGERFSDETSADSPACIAKVMVLYEKLEQRRAGTINTP
jgi:hypothetical protein